MSKARSAGFLCAVLVAQMEYGSRPVIPLRNPPWFTKKPAVHGNPNPGAPLAATVEFATDRPVRARLLLKEGRSERLAASWMPYQKNYSLPILGLRPATKNVITVAITDRSGNDARSRDVVLTTPALPSDFPPMQILTARTSQAEPGFRLFSVISPASTSYGLVVVVNERGEVVW